MLAHTNIDPALSTPLAAVAGPVRVVEGARRNAARAYTGDSRRGHGAAFTVRSSVQDTSCIDVIGKHLDITDAIRDYAHQRPSG